MTWLDEILRRRFIVSDKPGIELILAEDGQRMARVIRELARYMLANNALEGANSGVDPSDIARLRELRQTAWDNLSSDATEVLYEMQTSLGAKEVIDDLAG